MKRKVRIGSRDSVLAVQQARIVIEAVNRCHPELDLELITMKTTGDLHPQVPFEKLVLAPQDKFGVKGLFVKELEQALLDGRIDLAVHSLKDMPMEPNAHLPLCGCTRRGDPRDALVLPLGCREPGKGDAGCSSARRRIQLARLMPERETRSIRGNVLTRLKKLDDGQYAFLVLAAAGLSRLRMADRVFRFFSPQEMIPAAGQGTLTCQGRSGENYDFLESVRDREAEDCAGAERAFVKLLGGGCTLPVGAYAEIHGTEIGIRGLYADESRGIYRTGFISGDRKDALKLGEVLAARLKNQCRAEEGDGR